MLFDNLEKGQQYILKCKEKDLTHNMREFYKHDTILPVASGPNVFSKGKYFYSKGEGNDGYIRIYDNEKENYILTFSTDQKLIKLESAGNIELIAQNDIIMQDSVRDAFMISLARLGYSINSTLHSVPACQSIVKKAAAERLGHREFSLYRVSPILT